MAEMETPEETEKMARTEKMVKMVEVAVMGAIVIGDVEEMEVMGEMLINMSCTVWQADLRIRNLINRN
jgi:hypothetical protein